MMHIPQVIVKVCEFILDKAGYEIYQNGRRLDGVSNSEILSSLTHNNKLSLASRIYEEEIVENKDTKIAKLQKRLKSAISNYDIERIEYFISLGASPSELKYQDITSNVLRNSELLEMLINNGFDINQKDYDMRTPLHRAAQNGYLEAAKMFLKYGADPQARDREFFIPLELAEDRDKENSNYSEMIALLNSHHEKKTLEKILEVNPKEELPKKKTMKI